MDQLSSLGQHEYLARRSATTDATQAFRSAYTDATYPSGITTNYEAKLGGTCGSLPNEWRPGESGQGADQLQVHAQGGYLVLFILLRANFDV